MLVLADRRAVPVPSGELDLAAYHYAGTNGACVVMGSGLAVTKEPGTDRFARRFHEAGFSVLAFDFRRLGGSAGHPRQVVRLGEQLADWGAALTFAGALPEVDPTRVVAWGFSLAGGQVLEVAAAHPGLAAAIVQAPLVDGRAAAPSALRHTTPGAMLRLIARAVADAAGGLVGREPRLVPLAGARGTVALLTTPDAQDAGRALDPDGAYADWQQAVAARAVLAIGSYRPARRARQVGCPLLVVAYDDDMAVLAGPAARVAERAPRGELVRLSGGHYAAFLDAHEDTVSAELSFLRRHVAP
jgi:pimeloyl-ACP methyl ester carboxylesterase